MQEIRFVTSNTGKVASLNHLLDTKHYTVVQETIDIPEIQADTALEIVTHKATFAYQKLSKPLIVQDSAFHINALSGFPGPYIKYINETIGIEGVLQLMSGVEDRSAYFEQALVYIDNMGAAHSFVSTAEKGAVAQNAYGGDYQHSWSSLWKIYIPSWSTKTLAELSMDGQARSNKKTEISQFVGWLEDHSQHLD